MIHGPWSDSENVSNKINYDYYRETSSKIVNIKISILSFPNLSGTLNRLPYVLHSPSRSPVDLDFRYENSLDPIWRMYYIIDVILTMVKKTRINRLKYLWTVLDNFGNRCLYSICHLFWSSWTWYKGSSMRVERAGQERDSNVVTCDHYVETPSQLSCSQ